MLSRENNERLTRVGPGTPMGELMREYWIPAAFSDQIADPDSAPLRVRLLCEDLVVFRDTTGRVGMIDEHCPHRLASMFFGRNEHGGLRCVYHGLKFDVMGNCIDAPCLPPSPREVVASVKDGLRTRAYVCIERAGIVWTYMGKGEPPAFPDLEWTNVPASHRYATRHIQECNWLQGLEGGFDAPHLTFLHAGANSIGNRDVVPSFYEVESSDFGFIVATGRDFEGDKIHWNINIMLMPFHKIISVSPFAAHVWAPIDDENTMLYSVDFQPDRALTEDERSKLAAPDWIHSENEPGSDIAKRNKRNDYLIDRKLQASGKSFTGIRGFGAQDCAIQESMGAIVDRSRERLLKGDEAIIKLRQLYLRALNDRDEGRPLPGHDPRSYRVRSRRCELPRGVDIVALLPGLVAASDEDKV